MNNIKSLWTNERKNDEFYKEFNKKIKTAENLVIASGYFGKSTLEDFESSILRIAKNGKFKLLIGMAYHEGLYKKSLDYLQELNKELQKNNSENGIYVTRRKYHGKIYRFEEGNKKNYYLGSSNFSSSGLKSNVEATSRILTVDAQTEIDNFLLSLFDPAGACKTQPINLTTIPIKGESKDKKKEKGLEGCLITAKEYPSNLKIIGTAKTKLRPDDQPASSLNLYFEPGRKNKDNKYEPRPWYEIEITSRKEENEQEYYPKSTFNNPGITKSKRGLERAISNFSLRRK